MSKILPYSFSKIHQEEEMVEEVMEDDYTSNFDEKPGEVEELEEEEVLNTMKRGLIVSIDIEDAEVEVKIGAGREDGEIVEEKRREVEREGSLDLLDKVLGDLDWRREEKEVEEERREVGNGAGRITLHGGRTNFGKA